jgi:hypothetical protein
MEESKEKEISTVIVERPDIDPKTDDLIEFHTHITDFFTELEKEDEFPQRFYQAFLSGNNRIYQKQIIERKIFHEEWIDTVESYFPAIDKITRDPKSSLRFDEEVVAIEKAKKVNSQSVRHLAANTHLIKEIKEDNFVIPKKILTTHAEIEMATYENRFIVTLINRLFFFVKSRFDVVRENVESYEKRQFNLTSTFDMRETNVNMTVDLVLRQDLFEDEVNKKNKDLLSRIEWLNRQVSGLRAGPFMESLKNSKPVIPPIKLTNIFQKNVDYKAAYTLWLYLDKFTKLNFDIDVSETNLTFDRMYLKQVYQSTAFTFSTIVANQKALDFHYRYLDVNEYTKKGPKYQKKRLDDISSDLDPFVMEDSQINQYYLEQSQKIFEKNIDRYSQDSQTYEVALRKAIRDTIAITNAIYSSYFELNDDEDDIDVFRRLVKEDYEAKLMKAKNKARIARIIRETKEADYADAIKLEKKMLREVAALDNKLIADNKKKHIEEARKLRIEEKAELERKNAKKNIEFLDKHFEEIISLREQIATEHLKVDKKIKEEHDKLEEKHKIILIDASKKAKEDYLKGKTKLEKVAYDDVLKLEKKLKDEKVIQKKRLDETLKQDKENAKALLDKNISSIERAYTKDAKKSDLKLVELLETNESLNSKDTKKRLSTPKKKEDTPKDTVKSSSNEGNSIKKESKKS